MARIKGLVGSLFLVVLGTGPSLAYDTPPPACTGSEQFRFEIQAKATDGGIWHSDNISICHTPGSTIYLAVRTRMTVTSGQTQGWSFGVEHDKSGIVPDGGDIVIYEVGTVGTQTATVQNGSPPDTEETDIRPGGFTQGIVIDHNSTGITLGPTANFVTARACYGITIPTTPGTYVAQLKFVHTIGDPPIHTIVTQNNQSNVPCAKNLWINITVADDWEYFCDYPFNPYCGLSGGMGPMAGGPEGGGGEAGPMGGGGAGPQALGNPGIDFRRGDVNGSGSINLTDPIALISKLFLGEPEGVTCDDAADINDDDLHNVTDIINQFSFQFLGGITIPFPFDFCAPDMTEIKAPKQLLGCLEFSACPQDDADGDGLTNEFEARELTGGVPVVVTKPITSSTATDTYGRDLCCQGGCLVDCTTVTPGKPVCVGTPNGQPPWCDLSCWTLDGIPDPDCVKDGRDSDRDGFTDAEEILPTGVDQEIELRALGAKPLVPDVFVEVDWFTAADHDHKPVDGAMQIVIDAFATAPFEIEVNGQIRTTGINLRVDTGNMGGGNSIPEQTPAHNHTFLAPLNKVCLPGWTPLDQTFRELEDIKCDPARGNFAMGKAGDNRPSRAKVFHYCLFAHQLVEGVPDGDQSSVAQGLYHENCIVAMGHPFYSNYDANKDGLIDSDDKKFMQAGLFMHELGHTIDLHHGGLDEYVCKPNHVTVMTYRYTLRGLDVDCDAIPDHPIVNGKKTNIVNYSSTVLPPIHTGTCNPPNPQVLEGNGICGGPPAIDWNHSGIIEPGAVFWPMLCDHDLNDTDGQGNPVSRCLRNLPVCCQQSDCGPNCSQAYPTSPPWGFLSFSDWNLVHLGGPKVTTPFTGQPPPACGGPTPHCTAPGGGSAPEPLKAIRCFDE